MQARNFVFANKYFKISSNPRSLLSLENFLELNVVLFLMFHSSLGNVYLYKVIFLKHSLTDRRIYPRVVDETPVEASKKNFSWETLTFGRVKK